MSCDLARPCDQRSCELMEESCSFDVTTGLVLVEWKLLIEIHHFTKFGGHRPYDKDITDLIFYETLQDHVIKEPCNFWEKAPHCISHTAKFGSRYITIFICQEI